MTANVAKELLRPDHSLALHFTWKPEWLEAQKVLPTVEEKPAPTGQSSTPSPPHASRTSTPKLPDYRALVTQHDPHFKFRNQFIDANMFGS